MTVRALSREVVELLLPRACLACGERIPPEDPEGFVCPGCRSSLRPPTPPYCPRCQLPRGTGFPPGESCTECCRWPSLLRSARSGVVLDAGAAALVHALKYGGWRELADFMARRMKGIIPSATDDPVLVPVPTTPWRRWTRGYNQAAILAEALARLASLPCLDPLLRAGGRTQVRLGPWERQSNVRGAFTLREDSRSLLRGREVILIDDVLTTGATALAATSALEAAEVESVELVTFARSFPFAERAAGRR